ncbi:hypothetical protein ACFQJ5_04170 [Halomicroarcula sp. GCM10025324]|jgi:hypothetical protein|uniref:hypothetical protein n=1 Tax=Haloarcula TaxID=2237 RepID=UPI0023E7ADE1|nr:hypothetical protein [Halomicroarcula sp. ZS-22-S1]
MSKDTEACGRCSMTTVVDATADGERTDPLGGDRIEVSDSEARLVSPAAWLSGVKRRIDDVATRLTYGR